MNRLEGKVAIITGGNSGVGAATAMKFAAEGAKIVITARREAQLEEVAAKIREAGGEVLPVVSDISKPDDAKRVVAETMATFGKVDVLINNAGVLDNGLKAIDSVTDEDMDKVIADYKTIGCQYITIPYVEEKYRPGTPDYPETLRIIGEIGKKAKEAGLELLYHNHDFEFVKVDGEYGLDIMYSTVPAEYLNPELDTCWVNIGGENPAEYILKYMGRTPVIHLKDFFKKSKDSTGKLYELIGIDDDSEAADEDDFTFRPVGHGMQDIPAIIKAGEKSGAKWFIVEQDAPDKGNTELSAVKMSIEYLRSL